MSLTRQQRQESPALSEALDSAEDLIQRLDNKDLMNKYNSIKSRLYSRETTTTTTTTHHAVPLNEYGVPVDGTRPHSMPPKTPANNFSTAHISHSVPGTPIPEASHSYPYQTTGYRASAPPADTEVSRQIYSSLEDENVILRSQLAKMAAENREHRLQASQLKEQAAEEVGTIRKQWRNTQDVEVHKLEAEVDSKEAEVARLQVCKERLEHSLASANAIQNANGGRVVELEMSQQRAIDQLKNVHSNLERLHRHIHPSFVAPASMVAQVVGDPLGDLVNQVEAAVAVTFLIIDAKLETVKVVKNKLQEENASLKADLQRVVARTHTESGHTKLEAQLLQERDSLRSDIDHLQEQIQMGIQKTKQVEIEADERNQAAQHKYNELQSAFAELENQFTHLQQEHERLAHTSALDQNARLQLAADLNDKRKIISTMSAEMESIKLSQKFLGGGGGGGSGSSQIPADKMDMMKLLDGLLEETKKLKEENLNLSTEVTALKRASASERAKATVGDREISMVANDRVSDVELTNKFLLRNLQQQQQQQQQQQPERLSQWHTNATPSTTAATTAANTDYNRFSHHQHPHNQQQQPHTATHAPYTSHHPPTTGGASSHARATTTTTTTTVATPATGQQHAYSSSAYVPYTQAPSTAAPTTRTLDFTTPFHGTPSRA